MSFAYLPLYTGDYLRDTRHLSMAEHGAYFLALVYCWDARGPMPLDERRQFAICRAASGDEMEAWRRIRDEFFIQMDDGWYNRRMMKEIERSATISAARSGAASVRWQARSAIQRLDAASHDANAMQVHSKSNASATSPSPSPSPPPKPRKAVGDHLPERATARATRFALDAVPQEWAEFCKTARPDLSPTATFDRFADYWRGVPGVRGKKLDWPATWRNWVRNERAGKRESTPADVAALVEQLEREGR